MNRENRAYWWFTGSIVIETLPRNYRKHLQSLSRAIFGLLLGFSFLWLGLPAISRNKLPRDAFIPSAPAQTNTDRKKVPADEGRKRIAAGEYEVYEEANEGLVGPFGEEVRNFHESWTLWQNAKRGYEVEGERRFETLNKEPQKHNFKVELSRDFTVERMMESASLR